jgi:hypothetical protein
MTNNEVSLNRGDQYIVLYKGGPYDGQTDVRVSTDGSYDDEVTVLVALNGKETQVVYGNPVAKSLGDQVQVHYSFDLSDSEDIQDPDERLSEQ